MGKTTRRQKLQRWRELGFPRSIASMIGQHPSLPGGSKRVQSIGPVLLSMWVNTEGAELYEDGPGRWLLVVDPSNWETTLSFNITMKGEA